MFKCFPKWCFWISDCVSMGRGSAWLPAHAVTLWRPLMGCRWSRSTPETQVTQEQWTLHESQVPLPFLSPFCLTQPSKNWRWQDCVAPHFHSPGDEVASSGTQAQESQFSFESGIVYQGETEAGRLGTQRLALSTDQDPASTNKRTNERPTGKSS